MWEGGLLRQKQSFLPNTGGAGGLTGTQGVQGSGSHAPHRKNISQNTCMVLFITIPLLKQTNNDT